MKQEKIVHWFRQLKPYRFRIVWSFLFFFTALLMLLIGFWKTFLLVLFALVGYTIGKMRDEELDIYSLIRAVRTSLGL